MLTLDDSQKSSLKISEILPGHERYWAHLPPDTESRKDDDPETLAEHCDLVNDYALRLCAAHHLEPVIDKLIEASLSLNDGLKQSAEVKGFLKTLFFNVVGFHDFGKVNENFQVLRMKNAKEFRENKESGLIPTYGHSFLGTYIFIAHHLEKLLDLELDPDAEASLTVFIYALSYPILCHHRPSLIDAESDLQKAELARWFNELNRYLSLYQSSFDDEISDYFLGQEFSHHWNDYWDSSPSSFPLYALIKLGFSLLTASDYLATHEYMSDAPTEDSDLGVFSRDRIQEIAEYLRSNGHNKVAYDALDSHEFEFPADKSRDNLNTLRKGMAVEVIRTVKVNLDGRLFYIEAPTGGGKTNLSMIAVMELLLADPKLNKVFYVFPFTTLITQTYEALRDTLNLQPDELVELHSKAGFHSKLSDEAQKDGEYGDEKKDFIDNLFALYSVTVLSHVKFFDVLKSNRKETNYLLHRLTNSVVVIDELQSYNPNIWDKMLYFISQYAEFFNIRFIVMSATLPKISALNIGLTQKPEFVELLHLFFGRLVDIILRNRNLSSYSPMLESIS